MTGFITVICKIFNRHNTVLLTYEKENFRDVFNDSFGTTVMMGPKLISNNIAPVY